MCSPVRPNAYPINLARGMSIFSFFHSASRGWQYQLSFTYCNASCISITLSGWQGKTNLHPLPFLNLMTVPNRAEVEMTFHPSRMSCEQAAPPLMSSKRLYHTPNDRGGFPAVSKSSRPLPPSLEVGFGEVLFLSFVSPPEGGHVCSDFGSDFTWFHRTFCKRFHG